MDPSPTADATRFTDRARTSPAAKMPGMLVSSQYGSRAQVPPARLFAVALQFGPGGNETGLIALDQVTQPLGARGRADEDEEGCCGVNLGCACVGVGNDDGLQTLP